MAEAERIPDAPQATAGSGPLRIVAKYAAPSEGTAYTDVRWASDNSLFLSRFSHGVVEMELADKLVQRRQPVPRAQVLHPSDLVPPMITNLAASSQYLAVAAVSDNVSWRPRQASAGGRVRFEHKEIAIIDDFDLWGDRVVFLGTPLIPPLDPESPYKPGGIAWLGTLSAGLDDIKPVLQDLSGPDLHHLWTCSAILVGAVRFLEDGSFVVVPGYQPGAHLFDPAGRLVRSWSGEETGLTTDCSYMERDEGHRITSSYDGYFGWLNRQRVLEDVVPLPDGPGLLIRYMGSDGKVHWNLRVLRSQGGVETYLLPIETAQPFMRLHADARGGKIAFLLASRRTTQTDPADLAAELFIAEVGQKN